MSIPTHLFNQCQSTVMKSPEFSVCLVDSIIFWVKGVIMFFYNIRDNGMHNGILLAMSPCVDSKWSNYLRSSDIDNFLPPDHNFLPPIRPSI